MREDELNGNELHRVLRYSLKHNSTIYSSSGICLKPADIQSMTPLNVPKLNMTRQKLTPHYTLKLVD